MSAPADISMQRNEYHGSKQYMQIIDGVIDDPALS